jgi:hypothetical protein
MQHDGQWRAMRGLSRVDGVRRCPRCFLRMSAFGASINRASRTVSWDLILLPFHIFKNKRQETNSKSKLLSLSSQPQPSLLQAYPISPCRIRKHIPSHSRPLIYLLHLTNHAGLNSALPARSSHHDAACTWQARPARHHASGAVPTGGLATQRRQLCAGVVGTERVVERRALPDERQL